MKPTVQEFLVLFLLPLLFIGLLVGVLRDPAFAEGSRERGQKVYERCLACHALTRNRVGPKHCGLLGRRAGSLPGFEYSDAMKSADFVWSEETLDRFLAAPLEMLPETTMTYDGVKDSRSRADLIAFLAAARPGSALCP